MNVSMRRTVGRRRFAKRKRKALVVMMKGPVGQSPKSWCKDSSRQRFLMEKASKFLILLLPQCNGQVEVCQDEENPEYQSLYVGQDKDDILGRLQ